ncbi:asparagine synthase (glutamine-hydrolyzing) [Phycisphaerales bacterium AB-hyl4]|uniref:asparagine synthase (glutamine-hydrolyzing) n=1 Tax=Natronomicrosphaera hydrolytica TaxID=3242702 RepID=A0ABV4U6E4_9BACT
MCGIAGIAPFTADVHPDMAQLHAMCHAMHHRGPDDLGVEIRDRVALGMRRLSIIDLATGQQPITNETNSVRVIFNGEIYNYPQLRQALQSQGHHFKTNSDTEVLVHLYEQHGHNLPEHLNGMFAFALHDHDRQRLLLVRDHLGIKPLYYSLDRHRLVFGSEVKVLLASNLIKRELDLDALGQLLAWEYIPAPQTLLTTVRKLEPGCLLDVDLNTGHAKQHRYWDVPIQPADRATLSSHHWADAVDCHIAQAVQRQLISDVPLGAFLSGGVDSSLVAAHMGAHAQTFSIGFNDPTYNELDWAKRVADHLNLDHDYETIAPNVVDLFDRLMPSMDDPIGDFSIFPTYLVSQHARKHVTVALTGDGGDELFGGYETYLAQAKAKQWQRIPVMLRKSILEPTIRAVPPSPQKKGLRNKAKRFVEGFEHDDTLGHARWRLFAGSATRRKLFQPDALAQLTTPPGEHIERLMQQADGADELDKALYVDIKSYLADNCLVKMDRMSMTASLEARVPLLDKDLVELAFAMPSNLKVAGGQTKALLKSVAARHVPPRCVYRPKEGFSIPIKHWLKREFRPLMEDMLAPDRIREQGIFDASTIERLKHEHLTDRANHSHLLWTLIVFHDWRQRWQV